VTREFLTMFEFPVLKGDAAHMLDDPGSVVITKSLAKALFGEADPINQMVRIDNKYDQKVTGVLSDLPRNSSMQFDCLLPWKLYETIPWVKESREKWGNYSFAVYVELDNNSSMQQVNGVIKDVPARHGQTDMKREFFLYPLTQWKLYSHFENGKIAGGGIEYVQLFSIIAAFILIIACINFMNLATARSERRAKEVGIRKSVGSARYQLILQFISESLFISLVAFIIAILLTELLLPQYNQLVQKNLYIDYKGIQFWMLSGLIILITGVVSGSYPAFYLSSFQPVKVLKGNVSVGKNAGTPRKVLVTLQFGFSIVLIIGMLVIYQQVGYVKNRQMGFQKDNLISIKATEDIIKNYKAIKQELLQTNSVDAMTKSNAEVTSLNSWSFLGWPGQEKGERVMFSNLAVEYDYTKTMGIKLIAGRDFSQDFKSDSAAVIINKAALDIMGLKDPIGQQLELFDGRKIELIGVVENTIMGSPYEVVGPMFIQFSKDWINAVTIRIAPTDDLLTSIKSIERVFKKYSPAYPFEYKFVDEEFQKKFAEINLAGTLANLFASLAIIITGMGLFGLASFSAEQRTKEMGIRKVLGASVSSLIMLMSRDYSKLVIISFLIAAPVSWWMLGKFLERYSYHIEISWWLFPITGVAALAFALLVVSTQSLRAASRNPVRSLRNE